jgi:hypothetical protein
MSDEQPIIIIPQPPRNLCPICGKASYSVGGIHPQCAMQKADEPRLKRLRATKNAEIKKKKPARQSWQKKCPQCGTHVHVRLDVCGCGHKFGRR